MTALEFKVDEGLRHYYKPMFRFLKPQVFVRRKKTLNYRKKRNEIKNKDRYSMSKTGEDPLNPWFTKPRIQKMLKEVERLRNVNRFNIKFNSKLMKEYVQKASEHSELMLHRYFAEYEEFHDNLSAAKQVAQEAETLPLYLQDEISTDHSKFKGINEDEYLLKYFPQLIKILPPKVAENFESAGNMYEILVYDPAEGDIRSITD